MTMRKLPLDLFLHGFGRNDFGNPSKSLDLKEVNNVADFIRLRLSKQKSINKMRSSYGIKHDVERAMGVYVSNGTLIAAMILEGFSYERGSVNAWFNVTSDSLENIDERKQERPSWLRSTPYGTYLIFDKSAGLYKIGKSTNIDRRVNQIKSHNPSVSLVWRSDIDHEQTLHEQYSSLRVFREWFKLSNVEVSQIKTLR